MSMPSDHKALVFVGAVAVLGAGVRVARSFQTPAAAAQQPALDRQIAAADSAAHSGAAKHAAGGRASSSDTGQGRPRSSRRSTSRTSGARDSTGASGPSAAPRPKLGAGPLDRPGYVDGKLDVDMATAAQLDSLAGVSPTMARRIVMDRMLRGPFANMEGLRRVPGVNNTFVLQIQGAVMFSGAVRPPQPSDTVIPKRASKTRGRPARR